MAASGRHVGEGAMSHALRPRVEAGSASRQRESTRSSTQASGGGQMERARVETSRWGPLWRSACGPARQGTGLARVGRREEGVEEEVAQERLDRRARQVGGGWAVVGYV